MKTNAKPGSCCWCGIPVPAGAGNLFHVDQEDENIGIGPMGMTGWLVSCRDRSACKDRLAAAREAARAEAATALARRQRVKGLIDRFTGAEVPPGSWVLEGDELPLSSGATRIYGGGEWIVVEPSARPDRRIWHVRNNGSDGDDWSSNNVRTGGAGAIGRCLPWSQELEDEALACADQDELKHQRDRREKERAAKAERERLAALPPPDWVTADSPARIYSTRSDNWTVFCHTSHAGKGQSDWLSEFDVVEPGVILTHADTSDMPWQLWSDGKATLGKRLRVPDGYAVPQRYSREISHLIAIGFRSRKVDPEYKRWLLSMRSIATDISEKNRLEFIGIDPETGGRRFIDAPPCLQTPRKHPVEIIHHERRHSNEVEVSCRSVVFEDGHSEPVYVVRGDWWCSDDADSDWYLTVDKVAAIAKGKEWLV